GCSRSTTMRGDGCPIVDNSKKRAAPVPGRASRPVPVTACTVITACLAGGGRGTARIPAGGGLLAVGSDHNPRPLSPGPMSSRWRVFQPCPETVAHSCGQQEASRKIHGGAWAGRGTWQRNVSGWRHYDVMAGREAELLGSLVG